MPMFVSPHKKIHDRSKPQIIWVSLRGTTGDHQADNRPRKKGSKKPGGHLSRRQRRPLQQPGNPQGKHVPNSPGCICGRCFVKK